MSSDLWKEFGAGSEDLSTNPWVQKEESRPGSAQQQAKQEALLGSTSGTTKVSKSRPTVNRNKSTTWDLFANPDEASWHNHSSSVGSSPDRGRLPQEDTFQITLPPRNLAGSTGSNIDHTEVLFDATVDNVDNDDDDFGDFEAPEAQNPSPPILGAPDLLGLQSNSDDILTAVVNQKFPHIPLKDETTSKHGKPGSVEVTNDPYSSLGQLGSLLDSPPVPQTSASEGPKQISSNPTVTKVHSKTLDKAPAKPPSPTDDWGDFEDSPDLPMENSTHEDGKKQPNRLKSSKFQYASLIQNQDPDPDPDPFPVSVPVLVPPNPQSSPTPSSNPPPSKLPPTNIPPPSILLPFLSTLIQSLPLHLHLKQTSLATRFPLQTILSTLRVSARILAGRKRRWKRDPHLSQSMKIGIAGGSNSNSSGSGNKSGMKLHGLDKTESKREEREVEELLRVWKANVGKIRAGVVALGKIEERGANTRTGTVSGTVPLPAAVPTSAALIIPELSGVPIIKTLPRREGNSIPTCVLCGLNRDERVGKVDGDDVQDCFGEWWVEWWGHVDCEWFWDVYEGELRSR